MSGLYAPSVTNDLYINETIIRGLIELVRSYRNVARPELDLLGAVKAQRDRYARYIANAAIEGRVGNVEDVLRYKALRAWADGIESGHIPTCFQPRG